MRASARLNIVFFGEVRGGGNFTGTGTTYFEGGYSPGNSPALITFGGNTVFGTFNTLFMEVGGTARGAQYDAMDVADKLTFDGFLNVSLINAFVPSLGNAFNLFDWGTTAGTFTSVSVPTLNPGLAWDQSTLYTAGTTICRRGTAGRLSFARTGARLALAAGVRTGRYIPPLAD